MSQLFGLRVAVALAAVLCLAACGETRDDSGFVPREFGGTALRPTGEAAPGELTNRFLSPGRSFAVTRFEVPALPCVRSDSEDYFHIPEATQSPGGAAVFFVVPPADSTHPVIILFHGNGLDFIEAEASLFGHAMPELARSLLEADPSLLGYVEIDNRNGALRGIEGTLDSAYAAEALERGWGVVVPGNCWGDGGHGTGEIVDYYIPAPRYGHIMDRDVWDWFRSTYAHDDAREYSFGCSGGGQRTAQLLLHDPEATAASAIDSPADYLPGFRVDPPGLFALLASIPEFPAVLDAFYIGHYGSLAEAANQSLGTQLLARGITTPIYLAYSSLDTFVTNAVSGPLVAALTERIPADRAVVWNSNEPVHCQVNTRARAQVALDWMAQWRREEP